MEKSTAIYATLASEDDPCVRVGRQPTDEQTEKAIFSDIWSKLRVEPGNSVLDVGCGCGNLAMAWLDYAQRYHLELTLLDIPAVIERLRVEITRCCLQSVRLVPAIFPISVPDEVQPESFDRALMYSVLHYSTQSALMLERLVQFLKPGGRLLIGDVPNLTKRGRFLTTARGRQVEAEYRGKPIAEIPVYQNSADFEARNQKSAWPHLNDRFTLQVLTQYRAAGYDVYVMEQPDGFPFSHTREDLLICKPSCTTLDSA